MKTIKYNISNLRENQINFNEILKSFIINSQINAFKTTKNDEKIYKHLRKIINYIYN